MKHRTVYSNLEVFAGWPANHGAWQWDDEFLVGFMRGPFREKRGMHRIGEPFQKVLARSLDGGETWKVEVPNVDFDARPETIVFGDKPRKGDILRFCGRYDHGGESCDPAGGCYWSSDRGRTWQGPRAVFPKIPEELHCTTRTCVLGDLVFLSYAVKEHWGSDVTQCYRWLPEEPGWLKMLGVVLQDEYRAVMPAAANILIGDRERIVVALRRRGPPRKGCWIDSVYSDDGGETWSGPVHVADTGINNGNPPALIATNDGVLHCAYANRSDRAIYCMRSTDRGETWGGQVMIRQGAHSDIGYPRLFLRKDGKIVCVYYWSENGEPQSIQATIV